MTAPGDHEQKPAQGASSKACPVFDLGRTVITPAALEFLRAADVFPIVLLHRHSCGDHGEISAEAREANAEAIKNGERVFSRYDLPKGAVWVITEWDRSVTTILLPSDY